LRPHFRALAVIVLLVVAAAASAQTFRIGSAAPENSPWGRTLNRLAAEWQEISNGRVRVQVFHNAIAGDEADMVRKMRIGQLQAIVMTTTGLTAFSDGILTLSMPLLIRDQAEYDHAFEAIRPELEAEVEDDGFRVLAWSTAGWLYFFTDVPVRLPDELRGLKLAANPEEMELVRAYQLMGYQPIAVPYTERLAALANGMVNSYLTVPILAAGFQWFGATPNMLDMKVGPAPGAIVISERAYNRLPREYRDEMVAAARRVAEGLNEDILELEQTAIDTMVEFGLNVVEPTPEEVDVWVDELESSYEVMLGLVFDESIYSQIRESLRAYRAGR
jgi:TRAP-type transport system periplasmic protein